MGDVERYVTALTTSDWWIEQFPAATVGVRVDTRSSSASFAVACGELIAIPNNPRARQLGVVLHELAHVATDYADGHGPIFRSALIRLVRKEMGFFAAIELEREYRKVMSSA
jgi:putative metallohydrolase (TIGR04338 family)